MNIYLYSTTEGRRLTTIKGARAIPRIGEKLVFSGNAYVVDNVVYELNGNQNETCLSEAVSLFVTTTTMP